MDSIITNMKILTIYVYYSKAVVPFIDGKIARCQITQASQTVSSGDLSVHVAFGVLGCLVIMSLHG
jgi:hypothetical protein